MKLIDAHTHIDYITPIFQKDVIGAVCCATQESDWQKILKLIKVDGRIYGAFGIHPWFIDTVIDSFDERLKQLLQNSSDYMVGEIGLDKYKPDMERQMDVFIKQFELAIMLKRIVCLHCVGAWDKILHILKQYNKEFLPPIIVHGFNENEQIMAQLLQYKKIFFSVGKNAVYGKKCRIERIPSNRILIETDGKDDVMLLNLCNEVSRIKNESNICDVIYKNMQKVLNNE